MFSRIGIFFYTYRGFLPVPLFGLVFLAAQPKALSFLVGFALAAAGEGGRVWALTYIGPKSRAERKTRASRLIREGPFSLVRNPLYVANMMITLGILLAANRLVLLAFVPVMVVFYILVVRAEQHFLKDAFPSEAESYFREVRAFIPAIRRPVAAQESFSLGECLLPELSTMTAMELCLGVVGLKLFLDLPVLLDFGDRIFPAL